MEAFKTTFNQLKALMQVYENQLILKADKPDNYYLDMPVKRSDGYAFAFGGVQIKKNYVSYHLLPVYGNPKLLEPISDKLKKRMQGKSCFNFKTLDDDLLAELKDLTQKSFETYIKTDFSIYDKGAKK